MLDWAPWPVLGIPPGGWSDCAPHHDLSMRQSLGACSTNVPISAVTIGCPTWWLTNAAAATLASPCGVGRQYGTVAEHGRKIRVGQCRPVDLEGVDGLGGAPVDREIPQDAAEQAGELERVAGPDRHRNLRVVGQPVKNELPIRRHGVEARLGVQLRPEKAGDAA